jgi:hypothetical protein
MSSVSSLVSNTCPVEEGSEEYDTPGIPIIERPDKKNAIPRSGK